MTIVILKLVAGLLLLVGGGEVLVRGATSLARIARISPLVIGLTVVAFGTSAPELFVVVQSTLTGNADVGVGNVVGSNIFNILFIVGLSALITPLLVSRQLITRDVPLMIVASVLLFGLGRDGILGRLDGGILFAILLGYLYWSITKSRQESKAAQGEADAAPGEPNTARVVMINIAMIAVGVLLLTFGSNWLVDGSVTIATRMGVSKLIIGLTIVAVGTSLPEIVTSIMAAVRGERDLAVGNAVGSNLFNILCVAGLASMVAPNGVAVSDAALSFDIPVMIAVAIVCLPIFLTGNVISRFEGAVFFVYYLIYTAYLILSVTEHVLRQSIQSLMTFVGPLTVIVLIISVARHFRDRAAPK